MAEGGLAVQQTVVDCVEVEGALLLSFWRVEAEELPRFSGMEEALQIWVSLAHHLPLVGSSVGEEVVEEHRRQQTA